MELKEGRLQFLGVAMGFLFVVIIVKRWMILYNNNKELCLRGMILFEGATVKITQCLPWPARAWFMLTRHTTVTQPESWQRMSAVFLNSS